MGLLAAAVCGIDIQELLAGAAYMDGLCQEPEVWKNPAYMLAALEVLAMEKGCNIGVLMPYADSLKYISDWYAQLWAESLGKNKDLQGNPVHTGQTPVKAWVLRISIPRCSCIRKAPLIKWSPSWQWRTIAPRWTSPMPLTASRMWPSSAAIPSTS